MLDWLSNDNGDAIPVIDGKPLCSRINPQREAMSWAEKTVEKLYSTTDAIVVLGYGAGYHIKALQSLIKHKIYVFENIEEIYQMVKNDDQVTVLSVEGFWHHPKLKEIVNKRFQIFQHYPSTSPFVKDYDNLRHNLSGRNRLAFKKQIELYVQNSALANIQFEESNELLSAKDISQHPSVNNTSNQKVFIWKILGELIK
jgi:shikimate kinase